MEKLIEKQRVGKTLHKLRNVDLKDKKTKNFVKDVVPDIDVSDLFIEKKKKNAEDEGTLF